MTSAIPWISFSYQLRINLLERFIIAPVTKRGRQSYPTRRQITTENSISGWIVLDQIRAIDKSRLRNKISSLNASDIAAIKSIIQEMLVD